jgi:multiple sugar transport system substrate-binding protein
MEGYYPLLTAAGGWIYAGEQKWVARSPAMLEALGFYKTVYRDEQLGDARLQLQEDPQPSANARFRDGQIAMFWQSDYFWRSILAPGSEWAIPNRDAVVGFAKIPAKQPGQGYRGQDFVTASGGVGFILNPHTRHPQEAWALLSFMFSREMLLELQGVEPRLRARDDVLVVGDPVMTELSKLLPLTVVRPARPLYPTVSHLAQVATERVITGEMTPEQAVDAYARELTEVAGPEHVVSQQ